MKKNQIFIKNKQKYLSRDLKGNRIIEARRLINNKGRRPHKNKKPNPY